MEGQPWAVPVHQDDSQLVLTSPVVSFPFDLQHESVMTIILVSLFVLRKC